MNWPNTVRGNRLEPEIKHPCSTVIKNPVRYFDSLLEVISLATMMYILDSLVY